MIFGNEENRKMQDCFLGLDKLEQPEIRIGDSWDHQVEGYHLARNIYNRSGSRGAGAGLFFDMGTGKTRTAIHLLDNSKLISKVLIVTPKKVIPVWPGQFEKHSATHEDRILVVPNGKSVRDKAMEIADAVEAWDDAGQTCMRQLAIVINYDSAWRDPLATTLKHCGFNFAILDEAHRLKSPGSRASKYFGKLGKIIPYRLALTGTPLPHSPLDAWAMYRFLQPGLFPKYLCWNIKRKQTFCDPLDDRCCFRNRYAVMGGFERRQVIDFKNRDELHEKMFSIAMRVKKDVLNLPPAVHVDRRFSLSPKTRKMYQKLEDDLFAEVDEGRVTAANVLVKLLRLQQITSGHVKLDDGRVQEVHSDKEDLLNDMFEDLPNEPIVVFYRFRPDAKAIARAAKKAGRSCGEVSGDRDDVAAWQRGELDVLAAQVRSGSEGLDFTRSAYAVFFSVGFSLAEYEQCLARLHRGGQTRSVTYYHLIAMNTIDTRVYYALQKRKEIVESVLTQMREGSRIAS